MLSPAFRLNINVGNSAFDPDPAPEVVRLLREIADQIEKTGELPHFYKTIFDCNGNDVGRYAVKETGQ